MATTECYGHPYQRNIELMPPDWATLLKESESLIQQPSSIEVLNTTPSLEIPSTSFSSEKLMLINTTSELLLSNNSTTGERDYDNTTSDIDSVSLIVS